MKVYFGQPWGGLGDNLQFTTLPRLFSEKGVDFFVSQHNTYRNPEIYQFCWANNPYVKGIVSNVANVGACAPDLQKGRTDNIVSAAEIRHGFLGSGRYPEIYYDAKVLDEQAPTLLVHKVGHVDLSLPKTGHVQQLALAHGPNDLSSVLSDLAERGCNDVLVEAGPKVIGSFVRAGLWDEWIAYIAPKLLGADSYPATDLALDRLPDAPQARLVETTQIGDDLRLTLRPRDL